MLLKLPHHHAIFTLPKRIRPYFRFDRSNIGILYQGAWHAWRECVAELCPEGGTGMVEALHTAGEFLVWHPHVHAIGLAGAIMPDGTFQPIAIDPPKLCEKFQRYVLTGLIEKELITKEVADNILSWEHSGFSAYLTPAIAATDTKQRLFVARYLKKCPISNERLSVTVQGKDTTVMLRASKEAAPIAEKSFSLLEFLAALQCHLPSRWEQTTRFFGIYSSRTRGEEKARREAVAAVSNDGSIWINSSYLPEPRGRPSAKWAECMKRTFEVDPLQCPKCGSPMKIKAFITNPDEVERISTHLGVNQSPAPPPLPCYVPEAA